MFRPFFRYSSCIYEDESAFLYHFPAFAEMFRCRCSFVPDPTGSDVEFVFVRVFFYVFAVI